MKTTKKQLLSLNYAYLHLAKSSKHLKLFFGSRKSFTGNKWHCFWPSIYGKSADKDLNNNIKGLIDLKWDISLTINPSNHLLVFSELCMWIFDPHNDKDVLEMRPHYLRRERLTTGCLKDDRNDIVSDVPFS